MNDQTQQDRIHNPDRKYVPSGKSAPLALRTYALFAAITAVLIQIPFGLTEGLIGFVRRFSPGLWVVPIMFGGIGFLVTGGILGYLMSLATKRGHCRNPITERTATIGTIGLSFCLRLVVTTVFLSLFGLGKELNAQTVFDLPPIYLIETLVGFGVVSFAAFAFRPKMKPYCEACGKYMNRQQHLFAPSELNRILSEIAEFTRAAGGTILCREWKRTKDLFPSAQIILHICDRCHNGFLSVDSNTVTIKKDGKEQRSSATVYSDQSSPQTTLSFINALQDKPKTNA